MFIHSLVRGGIVALLLLVTSPAFAQVDAEVREKFEEAQALIQEEQFEDAVKILREITESNEDSGPAWFFLGYSLHMNGDLTEALAIHKKVAAMGDERFSQIAAYNIACAYCLLDQKDEAVEALEKAVEQGFEDIDQIETDEDLFPLHTDVRFAKVLANLDDDEAIADKMDEAEQHLGSGDFAKAAEVYKAILNEDKGNAFATYRLGYSLHGAGDLDEALEMHTKATRFDGVAPIATYNIACVHALRDNKDEAFATLEKAVGLGFLRPDALADDPDLNNLREDDRFKKLTAKVSEMYEAKQSKNKQSEDDNK